MSNKLNFTRNISLEKEELIQLQSFLTNNAQKALFEAISLAWGIIPQADLSGSDFLVVSGSSSGTIQVIDDSVAIDSDSLLLALQSFDNYPVPDDSAHYWLKVSHRYLNVEVGTISINTSGEVAGAGTLFTELLRNQTSGSPIKIKFYKEDVQQVEETINNDGIYEIVEIINDGSMTLAGNFVAESNLKYIIIGSVALGTTLTTTQKEGIYSYNNCALELIAETVSDTPPTTGFIAGKDFYIARVRNVGGTISISDKRSGYYWTLDLGVTLPSKADRNATNITTSDALLWLEKLMVHQNEYVSLVISSGATIYDLSDTYGLIDVTGSATSFSYRIKLSAVSSANKGKIIAINYNLNSTTASSSYFKISDISNNIFFSVSWAEIGNKRGIIYLKSNGSTWGVISTPTYNLASIVEAQAGVNNTNIITPATLESVLSATEKFLLSTKISDVLTISMLAISSIASGTYVTLNMPEDTVEIALASVTASDSPSVVQCYPVRFQIDTSGTPYTIRVYNDTSVLLDNPSKLILIKSPIV